MRLSPGPLVLEAAVNGLGVALGRATLVNDELREGRLVRPLDHAQATTFSYYLVQRPKPDVAGHISAFVGWLRDEAADWLTRESQCRQINAANHAVPALRRAESANRSAGARKKSDGGANPA